MDLPHLKLAKTGNAKYRRRVTSAPMRAMLGKSAVEWSLKTRDPLKIVEAWKVRHAEFEAMEAKAEGRTTSQIEWDMLHSAAVAHGLAQPGASRIGPVDSELESGRHAAFTAAALAEAEKTTPQQALAKYGAGKPVTAFELLAKAQMFGAERPPVTISNAVEAYLKDRELRSSYADLSKQVQLVVSGLEDAMDKKDPSIHLIDEDVAYAYRDSLIAKGNALGTIQRRITTIKAVLNHGKKRFKLKDWDNPFAGLEMPEDDGIAGEVKRDPLTLEDIRKIKDALATVNDDVRDIWHLMMFTGMGPNEARGLQWDEVHLDDVTPHFEVKPNGRRRLKAGERRRRVPLVGTALMMLHRRRDSAPEGCRTCFRATATNGMQTACQRLW